jgi:uncharacterized damage-inducible protein DinB
MKLFLILVSFVTFYHPVNNATLTNGERRFAIRYLNETQRDLEKAIKGLSDSQINFKNKEQGWTIAECLQHLAVVEGGVLGMVKGSMGLETQPILPGQNVYTNEGLIEAAIKRSEKLSTPEMLQTSKYSKWENSFASFNNDREEIKKWIEATQDDLHAHVLPHPVYGMLDTYQWILLLAAHSQRHISQIEEVQVDPGFPKNKK